MSGQPKLRNKNTKTDSDKGTAKPLNSPKKLVLKGSGRGKNQGGKNC